MYKIRKNRKQASLINLSFIFEVFNSIILWVIIFFKKKLKYLLAVISL